MSEGIHNSQSTVETKLLDLAAPERFVALRAGEKRLVHRFAPPTADDWIAYERTLKPRVTFTGEEIETHVSQREAADDLWRRRIKTVEGYPFNIVPQWTERVPLEHRALAVSGLDRVQPAADQDSLRDSETIAIKLEAWWNGEFYSQLVHRFKRPLVEHELRFQEAAERRALLRPKIGGQRKPASDILSTRALPQLPTLVALYEELIVETEGYLQSPGGFSLMDTPHKAAAIRELFRAERIELDDSGGGDAH